MKAVLLCLFGLLLSLPAGGQTFYGSTDLKIFRDGRDAEFRNPKESPLDEKERNGFTGLRYYPTGKTYRVVARFTRTLEEKFFDMLTSTGVTRKFVKYGFLDFRLRGQPLRLSVYQVEDEVNKKYPEYAHLLFVPFKDATNRTETYGGGRYIDIVTPKGDSVILDFNLAYNPSCAYGNSSFSCPVPPSENRLSVAIAAGEKRYRK